jgi:hypothetical protein
LTIGPYPKRKNRREAIRSHAQHCVTRHTRKHDARGSVGEQGATCPSRLWFACLAIAHFSSHVLSCVRRGVILHIALSTVERARGFLQNMGCNGKMVCLFMLRCLMMCGVTGGVLTELGSGACPMAWKASGMRVKSSSPPDELVEKLLTLLLTHMVLITKCHAPGLVCLMDGQDAEHLLCEGEKVENAIQKNVKKHRNAMSSQTNSDRLLEDMRLLFFDMGANAARTVSTDWANVVVPEYLEKQTSAGFGSFNIGVIGFLLDVFEACLVAWLVEFGPAFRGEGGRLDRAQVQMAVKHECCLREGAMKILCQPVFFDMRRCQWCRRLDAGSLVNWRSTLRPISLRALGEPPYCGWAVLVDRSWLSCGTAGSDRRVVQRVDVDDVVDVLAAVTACATRRARWSVGSLSSSEVTDPTWLYKKLYYLKLAWPYGRALRWKARFPLVAPPHMVRSTIGDALRQRLWSGATAASRARGRRRGAPA